VPVGAVGKSAPARSAGVTGSTEPDHCRIKGDRARGGEVSGGKATDDPSRRGCTHRIGIRTDPGQHGALSMRETGCHLSGGGAGGKIQRETATLGAHHETRKFHLALSTGGSGPGHGTQRAGMAQQVFPSGTAAWKKDRQSSNGAPISHPTVLDVA